MVRINESYITFKNWKYLRKIYFFLTAFRVFCCLRESGILHSVMFLVCLRINKLVGRDFQKHKLQPCSHLPCFLQLILTGFQKTVSDCSSQCWCSGWGGGSGSKNHGLLRALSLAQSHNPHRWGGETLAQECGWFALRARPGADWEPKLATVLFTTEHYDLLLCCCDLLSFPSWPTNSFYKCCYHA